MKRYVIKSGLESKIQEQLKLSNINWGYETEQLKYNIPARIATYTPDFIINTNSGKKIYIEAKGRFTGTDRKKIKLVVESNPDLDIRFIFTNSNTKISKVSKTTYGDWVQKLGLQFHDKYIPESWLNE